ncbi:MAG: hypothetical protein HZA17_07115 [Nitrospirae bacterium]|nr:hypothetical protein [Nitrospirota bacterium]
MTKLKIQPGACGMQVDVEVEKKDKKTYAVRVTSECAMARKLGDELGILTFIDAFKRLSDNPVYKKASVCINHVACPVPSGILKALEVEAGLAVARDVCMIFIKDEGD